MIAVVSSAGGDGRGGGLGPTLCRVLDEHGFSVVAWDRDARSLAQATDRVNVRGAEVVDVSDPAAVDLALSRLDEPPALVINRLVTAADANRFTLFEELSSSDVEREVTAGLLACSVLCSLALRRMSMVGRGVVVNVFSAVSSYPAPGRLIEGAASAALESLTASLGAELVEGHPRVVAVALTPTRASHHVEPEATPTVSAEGRDAPVTDHEVAELIAVLASPAARALHGVTVRADRGFDPFPGLELNQGAKQTTP